MQQRGGWGGGQSNPFCSRETYSTPPHDKGSFRQATRSAAGNKSSKKRGDYDFQWSYEFTFFDDASSTQAGNFHNTFQFMKMMNNAFSMFGDFARVPDETERIAGDVMNAKFFQAWSGPQKQKRNLVLVCVRVRGPTFDLRILSTL